MVPNLTTERNQIKTYTSPRNGRHCVIRATSKTATSHVTSLREGSFCVNGARLFNVLPKHIRNLTDVELPVFKRKLDEFLSTIPDEPQSPGYTVARQAESNSLLRMIPASKQ